ncbi:MAG: ABC transporter permease [Chloroflexi bacterium]|nr:ABC transporter permease [Chloroflexota bacterium]
MRTQMAAVVSGAVAVGSKELRGRMRGPRAFIGLTLYLALLAGFTVMIYLIAAQSAAQQAAFGGGNPYASASVGQAVFTVLLFLQILLVVFLAPAATAGAISLEREKQTLDLLTATPISTLGIVVGKLGSALAFVFVLILASIPLTAVVFVFGGVGPEDILRGYLVLLVTALGFGSVGILLSSLTRRTQSATVLTYLVPSPSSATCRPTSAARAPTTPASRRTRRRRRSSPAPLRRSSGSTRWSPPPTSCAGWTSTPTPRHAS